LVDLKNLLIKFPPPFHYLFLLSDLSGLVDALQDEETGAWYQHKGRDFKVPLVNYLKDNANIIGPKKGFSLWPGFLKPYMLRSFLLLQFFLFYLFFEIYTISWLLDCVK